MNEKKIVQGKFSKINPLVVLLLVFSIICFFVSLVISGCFENSTWHVWDVEEDFLDYLTFTQSSEGIAVFFWLSIISFMFAMFFLFEMNFCKMEVTDKRVFGKAAFGKIVDLPLDKISSVGTCFPKGIIVATSSGKIKFWLLSNQTEVYEAISILLKERQTKTDVVGIIKESGGADELKKFKDLLDSGVITQEEFDAKKKQLLGL